MTGFRQTEDNRAGILEPVCSTVFLRVNPSGRKKNLLSSLLRHRESSLTRGRSYLLPLGSVAYPERFDVDPDPTFIFYVEPDPVPDQHNFVPDPNFT